MEEFSWFQQACEAARVCMQRCTDEWVRTAHLLSAELHPSCVIKLAGYIFRPNGT